MDKCQCNFRFLQKFSGIQWSICAFFFFCRANSASVCGDEEGIECDNSETASKYLKNKCNNKKRCYIKANPEVLSSKKSTPCLGKYLMVNYICRPPTLSDIGK